MLEDAQAIDTVVLLDKNKRDEDVDEAEDAQQLRQVAVIEEEQVMNDQKAIKKLQADADAIATAGGRINDGEIADAKVLEGFVTNEVSHTSITKGAVQKPKGTKGSPTKFNEEAAPKSAKAQKKNAMAPKNDKA